MANFKLIAEKYLESSAFESLADTSKPNYRSKINTLRKMGGTVGNKYKTIKEMDCRNSTKNIYVSILKVILNWAWADGLNDCDESKILPKKRFSETRLDIKYTAEEVLKIRASAETENEIISADFLIVLFFTGCRPSEVYNLKWRDVGEIYLSILYSKGKEKGIVSKKLFITPEIKTVLESQAMRSYNPDKYVFQNFRGNMIQRHNIAPFIKELAEKSGVEYKQLRSGRSGLATAMYKAGYTIYDIQGQLGHKSISTTARYIRPSVEERAAVFTGL